jgi:hypothetical protein
MSMGLPQRFLQLHLQIEARGGTFSFLNLPSIKNNALLSLVLAGGLAGLRYAGIGLTITMLADLIDGAGVGVALVVLNSLATAERYTLFRLTNFPALTFVAPLLL